MAGSIWVKDVHLLNTVQPRLTTHGHALDVQARSPLINDGEENNKALLQIDFLSPITVSEHIKESSLQIISHVK